MLVRLLVEDRRSIMLGERISRERQHLIKFMERTADEELWSEVGNLKHSWWYEGAGFGCLLAGRNICKLPVLLSLLQQQSTLSIYTA
jgi:hypothetical protein